MQARVNPSSQATFLTVEDIRRANARLMGELPDVTLSKEDEAVLERVQKICSPIKDGPHLRQLFREAIAR